jgi:hypothetical protein
MSVDFYGCESWSFTLREEHKVKLFENRVLRRILGGMKKYEDRENFIMRSFKIWLLAKYN